MRWSLRSLVALVTVIAIVLAYRQNTIRQTERATGQILEAGGQVIYRCQNAHVVETTSTMTPGYTVYKYNKETGKNEPVTHQTLYTARKNVIEYHPPSDVKQGVIEFCFGRLVELDANIVALPAAAVDANVVSALRAIPSLEIVLISSESQEDHSSISRAFNELESELVGVSILPGYRSYTLVQ